MGSACSGGQAVASVDNDAAGNRNDSQQGQSNITEGAKNQEPTARNGEIHATAAETTPAVISNEKSPAARADEEIDSGTKDIDNGSAQYKLIYFAGVRFRAEPIRLILRYANVPYEEQLVSFSEWSKMKESTPMGVMPILYIGDKVLCQTNAIGRYLARKYGLAGKTKLEAAKVDMFIDACTDVMNEMHRVILEQDPGKKSDLWHQVKDDVVCPFLDRCIKLLAANNSGWFVGNEVTWADLAISELLANLNEKMDSTLLDPYPALQAHINGVRSLPRISAYIADRPDDVIL